MTQFTESIYNALEFTLAGGHWLPMRDLERIVGARERGLQSEKNKLGCLDVAIEEIYRDKRIFLIVKNGKGGGVKLTKSLEEVTHAKNRIKDHALGEMKKAQRWEKMVEDFRNPQLKLI